MKEARMSANSPERTAYLSSDNFERIKKLNLFLRARLNHRSNEICELINDGVLDEFVILGGTIPARLMRKRFLQYLRLNYIECFFNGNVRRFFEDPIDFDERLNPMDILSLKSTCVKALADEIASALFSGFEYAMRDGNVNENPNEPSKKVALIQSKGNDEIIMTRHYV